MSTLREVILESQTKYGNKAAIIAPHPLNYAITYNELSEDVNRLGQFLAANGIAPGSAVSVIAGNGYPFLISFLAVTNGGFAANPLNPAYSVEEFDFYYKETEAVAVLVEADYPADHPARLSASKTGLRTWDIKANGKTVSLESTSEDKPWGVYQTKIPQPQDVALLLHTSGTTSKPKGVPLTHKNITTSIKNIAQWYELNDADRSLIVMPLFHVHGLIGATLSSLVVGGSVVIPPRFSATTFWRDFKENHCTWYSAVPTIHQILLLCAEKESHFECPSIRFIRSCSSSLAPAIFEKLEHTFKAPVLEAYGMTEACHQMTSNPLPDKGPRIPGSVGKGTNVDVTIRNDDGVELPANSVGEICIRGDNVTHGYRNRPEANEAGWFKNGNWFRTGDQGIMDENGYVKIVGRIKELINRGGEKISPVELDAVMLEHPKIKQAVSFGLPNSKYGEEVYAAAVAKEGAENQVTEAELQTFMKERIAEFKIPKRIFMVDELPQTATGKVQRRIVGEHFQNLIS